MSAAANHDFSTTNWSVVLAAGDSDPAVAAASLERLCGRYWHPVYAFVRQRGRTAHESEDLTQGFFHFVLERQALRQVVRDKGRFRTFVLTALTNFLHNERDRDGSWKRGGRNEIFSIEDDSAERAYRLEATNATSPERLFDRRWAAVLVERVLEELRCEHRQRGREALFEEMKPFLTGEPTGADYESLARRLDMEPGAIKVALHRARRRFGELLRSEVAHTVDRPDEIEAEIRHLLAAIAE